MATLGLVDSEEEFGNLETVASILSGLLAARQNPIKVSTFGELVQSPDDFEDEGFELFIFWSWSMTWSWSWSESCLWCQGQDEGRGVL